MLHNTQYDTIMREYSRRQSRNRQTLEEHRREVYEQFPRLPQIDQEVAALSASRIRSLFAEGDPQDFSWKEEIRALGEERLRILEENGYPADYLELHYDCPLCQDTGYIGDEKCICFKKAAIDLLYSQSNLGEILEKENFTHFSFQYYSDRIRSETTDMTAYEMAVRAKNKALEFVRDFDSAFGNLFLYGETGVGKTFLSHCIAKELIDTGHWVVYFSAYDLFELFSRHAFGRNQEEQGWQDPIFDCDLLIIDDLGAEFSTSLDMSQLFVCINERIARQKSTVISTNLDLELFRKTYSERTFSRILSCYEMLPLAAKDIRIQKHCQEETNMGQGNNKDLETLPAGRLGLISLESCADLGRKVDEWLVKWRAEREHEHKSTIAFEGYERDTYLIPAQVPRFGSGEAKASIKESVRGDDLYIMVDVCNYSMTYSMGPYTNIMSPDDHFQDLKRVIAAIAGKARRLNVIMPYLYESRQLTRTGRESLDCANALQELISMGVENILTFDAHDSRVQNATPLHGFETITPAYQFIKALLNHEDDLTIDSDHLMVISPDEGSMNRAIQLANVMGLDMGMFYKRRDYSKIVNGRHPVVAHEFLGANVAGKDMIIIDDMISSGDTILEVAGLLKERNVNKIFIFSTFGLFTDGLEKFDKAYEQGLFDSLFTTNLIYQSPELLSRPYYVTCDMSKYIALLIDTLNHDVSISHLLTPIDRINRCLNNYKNRK